MPGKPSQTYQRLSRHWADFTVLPPLDVWLMEVANVRDAILAVVLSLCISEHYWWRIWQVFEQGAV